jgi:ribosomal protein S18 acetylase RimI-like enzyme
MIRIATIDDIDSLVKFRIQLLNETSNNIENYDWDKYAEKLKNFYNEYLPNGKLVAFVAEENSNVIAMSIMNFYNITPLLNNLDGKMALLTDMYTAAEFRKRGFGTILLKNIMEYTQRMGYTKVILNATNAGRKLYEKYGFRDASSEMYYKFL